MTCNRSSAPKGLVIGVRHYYQDSAHYGSYTALHSVVAMWKLELQ